MLDQRDRDPESDASESTGTPAQRIFVYRVLRYVPSLLRDEGVNIGILLYDPKTGDRRLRMIQDEGEFSRIRRLRPPADEKYLRGLRDHLESRLNAGSPFGGSGEPVRSALRDEHGNPAAFSSDWLQILEKWDATLSQSLQLAEPRATVAEDINAEADRLYHECVRVAPASRTQAHQPDARRTRHQMLHYMDQVFRQAGLWSRIDKFVPASRFTLDNDPLLIDYSYLRREDKVRGFVQAISLHEKPEDIRIFSPVARRIQDLASEHERGFSPEFTAVTNVAFDRDNSEHRFLDHMLGSHGIATIPIDNFAVWVAKLRPMVQ